MRVLHFIHEYDDTLMWSMNGGADITTVMLPEEERYVLFDYWCYKNCHIVREWEKDRLEFRFQWKIIDERDIAMFLLKYT